jgi:AAA15 family ATPase/GTPase
MKIIEKIEIQFYRSLKNSTIQNLNHLNIFSGKNDVGKSNVLKALDAFFNKKQLDFIDEFNKDRLEEVRRDSIKGKQYIKIKITFNNPGGYKTLPLKFSVSKTWDRSGQLIEGIKDDFDTQKKNGKFSPSSLEITRRSLTTFLNRIRYTYVPAIRDERYFTSLLSLLQNTLFEIEEKNKDQQFDNTINDFNRIVGGLTQALNEEYKVVSGIDSSLSFPNEISRIFERLIIDTKSGNYDIPLKLRGDGLRLRYIPTILNYIAKKSRYFEIWGFDEPENSCEYSLSKKLSDQFSDEYIKSAQIFVATHSFNFIALETPETSRFRVYRHQDDTNSTVIPIDAKHLNELEEEMGIIQINQQLAELYTRLLEEYKTAQTITSQINEYHRPYLIFEGKTDNKFFELAYKAKTGNYLESKYLVNEHQADDDGSSVGSGAKFINDFLRNHITKLQTDNVIIGVFDYDSEGVTQLNGLKKSFKQISLQSDNYIVFQHKTKSNVFAMTLVPPAFRANFTHKRHNEYCYLTTELLLQDIDIPVENRFPPSPFDTTVFQFQGKKANFAEKITEKIKNGNAVDLSGFYPTLDLVETITALSQNKNSN